MFRLISVQLPYIEVELKNPSLNDSEQYDTNLRFARTRHNEPKVARDDGWPVILTRNYVFEVLTRNKTQELINFLVETASERVYMIDYNDEVYIVLITNAEYIITTARDDCNYNIPLDVLILESNVILPSPSPIISPSPSPSPSPSVIIPSPSPISPSPSPIIPSPSPSIIVSPSPSIIVSPSPSIIVSPSPSPIVPSPSPAVWFDEKSTGFDGISQYASGSIPNDTNWSASAWFKTVDTAGGIIQWYSNSKQRGLGISSGRVYGKDGVIPQLTNASYNDGNWHNAVTTHGGAVHLVYIDGALAPTTNPAGGLNNGIGLFIGRSLETPNQYLDGILNDLSYWDKILSLAEVQEIYNSGCPDDLYNHSAIVNLVHWWWMGDYDIYSIIEDRVGSNDLNMQGMSSANFLTDVPCPLTPSPSP